jgi:hypothetical protein
MLEEGLTQQDGQRVLSKKQKPPRGRQAHALDENLEVSAFLAELRSNRRKTAAKR